MRIFFLTKENRGAIAIRVNMAKIPVNPGVLEVSEIVAVEKTVSKSVTVVISVSVTVGSDLLTAIL